MHESWRPVTRLWLAVLNAFLKRSCVLFKFKHSCNSHQTCSCFVNPERKISPTTIDLSLFRWNLHIGKKDEIYHHSEKNILKLAKLPNLVAKYCKMRKLYVCEICNFAFI